MKKYVIAICIALFITPTLLFNSCIDDEFNIDNINKEIVFSNENGIYMHLGSFDTIFLASINIGNIEEITYIKNIENLFSSDFYDSFVITNNGKEEAIGSLSFEGDFVSGIKDAGNKNFSDIDLSIEIVTKEGINTGIHFDEQSFSPGKEEAQPFNMVIEKDDILKLKEAYTLRFIFKFRADKVENSDCIFIQDVRIKSSGGIKFEF